MTPVTTEPEGTDATARLETEYPDNDPLSWFTMFNLLEARDTVARDSADAVTVYVESEVEA